MRFFLSGYYGYGNAGDEAVLAAILDHVAGRCERAEFVVASGAPAQTVAMHDAPEWWVRAVPRQHPRQLVAAIRSCDVMISGGGSLLQDATSLRNVVYYTSLLRFARLARKPSMIYAQGLGPLHRPLARKLARAALNQARIVTLRDDDSAMLARQIGVARDIEVTADPVWALEVAGDSRPLQSGGKKTWCVSLRSWLGAGEEETAQKSHRLAAAVRAAADQAGAMLRLLPMQSERDLALMTEILRAGDEVIETKDRHPGEIMREAGRCDLMIAMRLHALIMAAAQGVPCIAIDYDPKVASLAKLIDAPVVADTSDAELAKLSRPDYRAAAPERLDELQWKALRNSELAAQLGGRN